MSISFVRSMLGTCLVAFSVSALAQGSTANPSRSLSSASELSARGSGLIVQGSVDTLAAASELTVTSIATAADVSTIVLRDLSKAAEISVQVASEVAGAMSLAIGTAVQVVAEATGYSLVYAGKVLAFIPNEAGKAMLHHSRQPPAPR